MRPMQLSAGDGSRQRGTSKETDLAFCDASPRHSKADFDALKMTPAASLSSTVDASAGVSASGGASIIPKIIHCCWFGAVPKSDRVKRCIESWYRVMPDWEIVEWSEANAPLDNAYCREACARGLWAMASDYARLRVLHTCGGVYLDTDVEVRKSLEGFLRHEAFVGFQVEEEQIDWVNNAVLGARRGHVFLTACLWFAVAFFERTGRFLRSPTVTTEILKMMGLREYGLQELKGVTIYPTSYFYPHPWSSEFSEANISDETYCIHHWERSWR